MYTFLSTYTIVILLNSKKKYAYVHNALYAIIKPIYTMSLIDVSIFIVEIMAWAQMPTK